jgi:hypothetical protein
LNKRGFRLSLRRQKQFANLGHPDDAVAEQVGGDAELRRIFREPEWIAESFAVIPDTPY